MKPLKLDDYTYDLPEIKIAKFPLPERDHAKLLIYQKGEIRHQQFYSLPDLLPANSFLFFNDTKVIPARLHFIKETGAQIEVFLLTPHEPATISIAMESRGNCSWKCTIGNLKRWNLGACLVKKLNAYSVEARLIDPENGIVQFSWPAIYSFAEVLNEIGETPLPPYLHRKAESTDRNRYQTVYSDHEGAVAAPTAGLHFTENTFRALKARGILFDFLTLHVSAGTFQPIKTEDVTQHIMHREQIILRRENLEHLLSSKFIVPVGTTSMRTLESVYWWGVKLLTDPEAAFMITQEDPYKFKSNLPDAERAIRAVASYMDRHHLKIVVGYSSIFILPGYSFNVCHALITNFHQPASTLILLVAAFVGDDWRKIYQSALDSNYRFLSYGDSSLLIPGGG